jgi:hypothetical protein
MHGEAKAAKVKESINAQLLCHRPVTATVVAIEDVDVDGADARVAR